ncbi:MAG: outer membrane beta-barrel family protein [Balneolaceae bacterium]
MTPKQLIRLLSIFFILFFYSLDVQSQAVITGTVVEENGSQLPGANVLLLQPSDSAIVKGAVTDNSGVYELNNIHPGRYLLSVSMIGFQRFTSAPFESDQDPIRFETITLQVSLEEMDEVNVTARRPMFEQEIDRLVVNVQRSITSSGSSVLQVLEKSPGIQVNRQSNTLSMSGKTGVRVMINDKFVQLPIDAVVQMLDGMSAANIDQIELITTPPARYEAEGDAGIIHIKMQQFTELGTTGMVGGNLGYNQAETLGGNVNISRRGNKLALYFDYSIHYDRTETNWINERFLLTDGFRGEISSDNIRSPATGVQNARAGMEVQISSKTTAGLLLTGYQRLWNTRDISDNFARFSPTSSLSTEMSVRETNRWRNGLVNVSLDHKFDENKTLNFDVDYLYFKNDNPSLYKNRFIEGDNSLLNRESIDVKKETPINIRVSKLDYRQALSDKFTMETGVKGSLSEFSNRVGVSDLVDNVWLENDTFTQDADLSEKTAAGYLSGNWTPAEDLRINAGLRFEYTDRFLSTPETPGLVDVQDGYLFPSLFIQKKMQNERSVGFSYARRITRPTFNDLAPFVFFVDPNTFLSGNSDLNPAISDALKLDYTQKQWLVSLQYSFTKNSIAPFQPVLDESTNEQTYSTQNLSYFRSYAINASFPLFFAPWWELRTNLTGTVQEFKTAHYDENPTLNNYGFSANITNTIDLPHEISFEVSGFYQSKSVWGIMEMRPLGSLNAGVQKRIASGRGMLRLSVDDILHTNIWNGSTDLTSENLDSQFIYDFRERNVKLTFTWNFGNSQIKSVDIKTGSEEEQSRVTN